MFITILLSNVPIEINLGIIQTDFFVSKMTKISSESVIEGLKDTVLFVLPAEGPEDRPSGTAFLVHVYDNNVAGRYCPYIVTNKHVLQNIDRDPDGTYNGSQYYEKVRLRFNMRGGQQYSIVDLPVAGRVIEHPNQAVDLAVIAVENMPVSDLLSVDASVVFGNLAEGCPSVTEGRDTMTVSLLQNYSGLKRNYPVCRFGKIALISNESWCETQRGCGLEQAWLVDLGTYEGASGSPVFLYPIQTDIDGSGMVFTHSGSLALVGVVKAVFNSLSDPHLQIRALTPIEPVQNLQDIFEMIFEKMRAAGWDPIRVRTGPGLINLH